MSLCQGGNQQFESYETCIAAMSGLAVGDSDRLASNSSTCRVVHAPLAAIQPHIYCASFSVDNSFCNDAHAHETLNLLGPVLPTVENRKLTQGIEFKNGVDISPLLEMQMFGEQITSWDPTWYPVGFIGTHQGTISCPLTILMPLSSVYWALLYVMAKGIEMRVIDHI